MNREKSRPHSSEGFEMSNSFWLGIICFIFLHSFVWLTTNFQFINIPEDSWLENVNPFWLMIILSVPTGIFGYYAHKLCFEGLGESAWALKFVAMGASYIVFPIMTWLLLGESMFTPKVLVSIFLSAIILWVQVNW